MPRRNQMLMEIVADDSGSVSVLRENTDAIEKMDNAARDTTEGLERVNQQQQRMRLSGNRANMVLMDTGRIIQDLPYGLRGVANNIDPFVQSLQRARRESGSWTNVLTGLGSAMTGPAGIAIAVSSLTTVMLQFGPQIADFFGIFDDGADSVENANEAFDGTNFYLQAIFQQLDDLNRFNEENDPFGIERVEERLEIVNERIKEYQNIFTTADQQRLNNLKQQKKETQDYIRLLATSNNIDEEALEQEQEKLRGLNKQIERLENKQKIEESFQKRLNGLLEERDSLERELAELQEAANSRRTKAYQREKATQNQLQLQLEALRQINQLSSVSIGASMDVEQPDLSGMMAGQSPLSAGQVALGQQSATDQQRAMLERYNNELAKARDLTYEHAESLLLQERAAMQLGNTVEQFVIASFQELGTIIGEVMTGDFEGGIFQRFQLLFGQFLSTFADQIIALGVSKLKLDALFSTGPAGAAALIASGIALKAVAEATKSDAQSRLQSITSGGGGGRSGLRSTGNVIAGYRGASAGQSGSGGPAVQFPSQVGVEFTDGQDNIVANGIMKMDRKGQNVYLGGGGNGS